MKTLILIAALWCGLSTAQRRLAKPIPLGFNAKYSPQPVPQYSPKPFSAQYSPRPTAEAPAQYEPQPNQQDYSDPSANIAAYSSPAPFAPSPTPRVSYQPEQPRGKEYVTPIPIIRFDKEQSIDGSYRASYETGNNIVAEETGFLKNVGVKDQEALVQHGSYSYTSPDGTLITVTYTADEGGFRAEGAHLPTPPPVPEEIQKSIDLIYENIRLQQEAASKDPKLFKALQEQEEGFYSDNYPQNR